MHRYYFNVCIMFYHIYIIIYESLYRKFKICSIFYFIKGLLLAIFLEPLDN